MSYLKKKGSLGLTKTRLHVFLNFCFFLTGAFLSRLSTGHRGQRELLAYQQARNSTSEKYAENYLDIAAAESFWMSTQNQRGQVSLTWEATSGGLDESARELLRHTYYNATAVFEFGIGESTRVATAAGLARYSGVDSDVFYIQDSRERADEHFKFYLADIGVVQAWGQPEAQLPKQVMQYQFSALLSELKAFDVYFVDGRWRVACACISFLHASKHGKQDALVLFHDYERHEYHVLETIARVVEVSVGKRRLAKLLRKSTVSDKQIFSLWKEHAEVTL